jgi:chromate reductase
MTKTFGLSGSLRAGSLNAGLLRAAAELAPDGTDVLVGTIGACRSTTAMWR